jgi:hypothetical protein
LNFATPAIFLTQAIGGEELATQWLHGFPIKSEGS